MQPWRTLSRRTILTHSEFLSVENHAVELPDGRIISEWPWVVTPDYVNVLAVTEGASSSAFARPSTVWMARRWQLRADTLS
jgi:hypothetical protein